MAITQEVKQYVELHVDDCLQICRRQVDNDLHELRKQIATHTLSEEQAEDIATRAAKKATVMAKKELLDDVKMEIAEGAIGIMKNAAKAIAIFIVGLGFYVSLIDWSKFIPPWR
jgi:hypothetical protein